MDIAARMHAQAREMWAITWLLRQGRQQDAEPRLRALDADVGKNALFSGSLTAENARAYLRASKRFRRALQRTKRELQWSGFLADHPELTTPVRLEFTDDELVVALAEAVRQREAFYESKGWTDRQHGASSRSVADVLAGNHAVKNGPPAMPVCPGDVIRVGRALGRLVREGRVEIASRRWESRSWAVATA